VDASDYQWQIATTFGDTPPNYGGEYFHSGIWWDGVNSSVNKFIEAKGRSYSRLIHDLADNLQMTGVLDSIVLELRRHAQAARRLGVKVDWHVAEHYTATRIRELATEEDVLDVINVIHTPPHP